MGYVVSVYTKQFFHEFVLPPINNADYSLSLHRTAFGLAKDLQVRFEVIGENWRICPEKNYKLYGKEEILSPYPLQPEDLLRMVTADHQQIAVLFREVASPFSPYTKYDISSLRRITIGKNEGNTIRFDYRGMISGEHAQLIRQGNDWTLGVQGRNGLYLNGTHLASSARLSFGDFINIIGLHLVFLGNHLAIDTSDPNVRIEPAQLREVAITVPGKEQTGQDAKAGYRAPEEDSRILFHRAPRNIEKIDTEEIEIEAPPTPAKSRKQPLLLTIGPSFTMAIPMLLGCLLMIYASRASGSGTGLFMYSGLVMSVSSALIGVIWATMNLRFQKKTEREEETHRFDAYSRYLVEKTEQIKEKYESNTRALQRMYPEAQICVGYSERTPELWNRNVTHEDFLSCRLGLGSIPFQAPVTVPKKKFTLNRDELEEKPRLIKESYRMLYKVPILIDVLHHPLIGIVGGAGKKGAAEAARLICLQIAANHCYTDVKLAVLYDAASSDDEGEWKFARWLPHVWSEDKKMRYVASERTQISDVSYELTKIFRQRKEEAGEHGKGSMPKPHFVLVLTDAALIEEELLSKYIFDKDETLGLSTLILSDTLEHLPNACDTIIQNDERCRGLYNISAQKEERIDIAFDTLAAKDLETFSRRLSNLEVQEIETGGEIPSSLTFFEMYGVARPEELRAEERWLKNRTYDNIRGLIGQKAGGADCYMDVHEKYHGPHGLVAGTTGSGKSETLQTYMLSLALNYSPDDVGFFIIDYKGGGMAHLFDGLPHLMGQISNLSGNQIHRAMVSIKSENRRRQRIFNESGVNNINAYTRLVKSREASEPVPHLFIIIDEFAELKKEEPDFMRELISVAQVGRSLGVHLILATQKPSGTVDDNIWSNSKFRLCLRVQDRDDSMDMLHKPDAAYITQAGRCYLQVGSDEVYELFQSGWSGAPYDESAELGAAVIARLLTLSGRTDVVGGHTKAAHKSQSMRQWLRQLIVCVDEALRGMPELSLDAAAASSKTMLTVIKGTYRVIEARGIEYAQGRYNQERLEGLIRLYAQTGISGPEAAEDVMRLAAARGEKLPAAKEKTQLDAVISYLAQEAKRGGYTQAHQLWMPILPEQIFLNEFEEYRAGAYRDGNWRIAEGPWDLQAVMGEMDDPPNQAQLPLRFSFAEGGHLAVIGSVVSGKSTFLQTLLYALTTTYPPSWLNIYGIDFSSKMLSAFEQAPHVGGIAYEGENERIAKLFHLLDEILEERKRLMRGGNYSQYVQVHGVTLPAILLVIDNFSAFKEKTEDKYESRLITLSKEGGSHGIFLAVTAGGISMNELPGRIAENIRTMICLELPDKFAYGDILHTMKIDVLPETGIKGRGLAFHESRPLEFQTALALRAEDDYQRMEGIAAVAAEMNKVWEGERPRQIPEIPPKPVWSEFALLPQVESAAADPSLLPVGYDAESAQVYSVDLSQTYCYLIMGSARTGKRNFMKILIRSALKKGAQVYIIDAGTDMNAFTGEESIGFIRSEEELFTFFAETLTPVFQERNQQKKALELDGAEEEELFAAAAQQRPLFLCIPDLPWFVSTIYADEHGMSGFMENLIQKGRFHNIYFVGILPMESRGDVAGYQMFTDFSGYHTGIHFGGNAGQNNILSFDYLGYAKQSEVLKPGIGLLPDVAGEHPTERVVVPLARWKRQSKETKQ